MPLTARLLYRLTVDVCVRALVVLWVGPGVALSHQPGIAPVAAPVTVMTGLRENRDLEGRHRFYRFRTPLRGRTHRFYWAPPFLFTKCNRNVTEIWGPNQKGGVLSNNLSVNPCAWHPNPE